MGIYLDPRDMGFRTGIIHRRSNVMRAISCSSQWLTTGKIPISRTDA